MKLRTLAKSFLPMDIKNSCTVKFWTDIWHPLGRIIDLTGEVGIHKLGIQRNARICEILNNNEWSFRRSRDPNLRKLVTLIKEFPLVMTCEAEDV